MFGRNPNIGMALGAIALSPVLLILVVLLESINYQDDIRVIILLSLALIAFLVNGIGLIMKKKWSLYSSTAIIFILTIVFIIDTFDKGFNNENTYYNLAYIMFILTSAFGSTLVLNSNIVQKEFGIEVIHNDLDEVLDA